MAETGAVTVKVSVCVTTYNRAPLLDRTLASLAAQSRLPGELIVSDDCSTDETAAVVERHRASFPRVVYHRNSENLYMPGNLNQAVSLAAGDYIANLHDADEFAPTLLEKWERALDEHPSAGFVFCGVAGFPRKGASGTQVLLHDVEPLTPGRVFLERHLLHTLSSIVWGTVMARRAAYARLLPFDARFGFISDVDMWLRMCERFDVAYVREPLIVLDNSPTKERRFEWTTAESARIMRRERIRSVFGGDPERLRSEMRRHRRVARIYYLKRIVGRIRHGDWTAAAAGCRLLMKIGRDS